MDEMSLTELIEVVHTLSEIILHHALELNLDIEEYNKINDIYYDTFKEE